MQLKMRHTLYFLFVLAAVTVSCNSFSAGKKDSKGGKKVVVHTLYGDIKIKLYDETPLHRDNFIKLVESEVYNGVLFHRVIKDFMIQTGDPDSKKAKKGQILGNGGPGYTIPAEFNPSLFHKKGALAAARQGDDINPKKESSGSQFYIVQGKTFTTEQLDLMEMQMNQQKKNQIINAYILRDDNEALRKKVDSLQKAKDTNGLNALAVELEYATKEEFEKSNPFSFTPEQRKIYTTVGGTPHLDGGYTVFGEVIEGLDVIDKIAAVETDRNNRPLEDLSITIEILD